MPDRAVSFGFLVVPGDGTATVQALTAVESLWNYQEMVDSSDTGAVSAVVVDFLIILQFNPVEPEHQAMSEMQFAAQAHSAIAFV